MSNKNETPQGKTSTDKTLTAKQQEVYNFLLSFTREKGYPPTVREICQSVNLSSTSSVQAHIERLIAKGYIKRDPAKPRAIEIPALDYAESNISDTNTAFDDLVSIPIIGTVTAGQPILAVENIEGYFPMQPDMLPNKQTFMLKVRGESMINAGILDGDLLIVEQTSSAHNGEMVVALIDDSATVKTYYKEADHVRLQPENDTMEPIIVKDVTILGKVVGLFRII